MTWPAGSGRGKTMAEPLYPRPAKLFCGVLFQEEKDLTSLQNALVDEYGPIDLEAGPFPFFNTGYYDEIGNSLQKVFFSHHALIAREDMGTIKIFSNHLEQELSSHGKRRVNIDPGYLTLSNVFLASCKDYYHRVYIGQGVYLENEYRYTDGKFEFWPWTYPDYQQTNYLDFFNELRKLYHRQLKDDT